MATSDVTAYAEADADFYRSLRERQRRMTARAVRRDTTALQTMTAEHRELRDLIAASDASGFDAVLRRHMDGAHRRALANQ